MRKKGRKWGLSGLVARQLEKLKASSPHGTEQARKDSAGASTEEPSKSRRESIGSTSSKLRKYKNYDQKEQLWNKLSEVVERRRVRFSKFVSVANEANTMATKGNPSGVSPTKDRAKSRRISNLAKPKKYFPPLPKEENEAVNNKPPKIVTPQAELSLPSEPEKAPSSFDLKKPAAPSLAQTTKLLQQKLGMKSSANNHTWMMLDFDEIKRNAMLAGKPVPKSGSDCAFNRVGSDSILQQQGPQIFDIIDTINMHKKKRLKGEIEEEMICIHNRVKDTLMSVDMLDEDEDLTEAPRSRFPPLSSLEIMKQRRERMYRERDVMSQVDNFKGTCREREAVIAEVNQWMANKNLVGAFENQEDIQKAGRYFQEVHGTIMTVLHEYSEQSGKVIELGNGLLEAAGAIIKENQENAKLLKEKQKEKVVVYDERQLLADPVKWENAVKMVLNTFEDAMKWTKNNTYKYIYQKGQKQFKEISFASKKRMQELREKKKNVEELRMKFNGARTDLENKTKQVDEMKKTVRTIGAEVEEKKHLLEKSEEKNKALQTRIITAEAKIKSVQEEAKKKIEELKKSRPSTPPPAKPATPPPPEIIKVIDSATQLKLTETEAKLEETKEMLENKKDEIRHLERYIRIEKERVRQLKLELDEAEKKVAEAELTITMPLPTNTPADPVVIEAVDKDSGYYKTLLSGMKREFSSEIEKLKSHLSKERQRNSAAVKKVENAHKDVMLGIQKDVVRVLRAIMHFRDHMTSILEKENLKDPAGALKELGSLVPDKLAPDPRELLAVLVGSVVDFLHSMESIMSNAFLTLRMIMKGSVTIDAQNQIVAKKSDTKVRNQQVEEVKKSIKNVDKVKTETVNLAKRLKRAKEKLLKFEELTDKQEQHDRKYLALLDRYRAVWKMYNHLQRDMDVLQDDFKDAMEAKIKEREDLLISKIKMDLRDRKVVHEQELRMSLADQRENLKVLEKAYDENKISKDLYNMASTLLHRTMEIPKKRLRCMMEQYIAFKTVKETKARVGEILGDEGLAVDVRRDMEKYVKGIDEKLNSSMSTWHNKMKSLEDEKKTLFRTIWKTFNDVFVESGVLLVHPLLNKSSTDKTEIYSKIAATVTKETLQKMVKKRRVDDLFELPSALEGRAALKSPLDRESLWNAQFQCSHGDSCTVVQPRIYTPHVIHYDVNKERLKAYGTLTGRETRDVYPLATSGNYFILQNNRLIV